MFNAQKLTFFFLLFALASTIAFTSCNDDEMGDPNPNMMTECDSFLVSVSGNDSLLFATIISGAEPFTYNWSEGSTDSAIDIFAAGTYSVTVTDGNDCSAEFSFTIDEEEPVNNCDGFNAFVLDSLAGDYTGLEVFVNGGTPPFTYLWSNGETVSYTDVTEDGTYTVTITDANDCTTSASFDYVMPTPCNGFVTMIDVSPDTLSFDVENDYILNAYPTGGTAPYTYIWNQGSVEPILYQVMTGTYSVTVSDAEGCTTEDEVIVE